MFHKLMMNVIISDSYNQLTMHCKKNRRGVSKTKFLLSTKKCWLIEEKLLPLYSRLVQSYSDNLQDTWTVKVEEFQDIPHVKQEPLDDYGAPLMYSMSEAVNSLEACYHLLTWLVT